MDNSLRVLFEPLPGSVPSVKELFTGAKKLSTPSARYRPTKSEMGRNCAIPGPGMFGMILAKSVLCAERSRWVEEAGSA
jgi:hypothetical protein